MKGNDQEQMMLKIDLPDIGIGFLSYQDAESFDFFLNVSPESVRCRRWEAEGHQR